MENGTQQVLSAPADRELTSLTPVQQIIDRLCVIDQGPLDSFPQRAVVACAMGRLDLLNVRDAKNLGEKNLLEHLAMAQHSAMFLDQTRMLQRQLIGQTTPLDDFEAEELDRIRRAMDDYLSMESPYQWGIMSNPRHIGTPEFDTAWRMLIKDLIWRTPIHRGGCEEISLLFHWIPERFHFGENGKFIHPRTLVEFQLKKTLESALMRFLQWSNTSLRGNMEMRQLYSPEERHALLSVTSKQVWNNPQFRDALVKNIATLSWDQLIEFGALVEEYNLEWAIAAMEW